jgi:hypothetical protein
MGDKSSVKIEKSKDELLKTPNESLDKEHELYKFRLQLLKESFDDYCSVYDGYMLRYYFIIILCGTTIILGIIILILKIERKENLLEKFKTIQSSFASIISGGSVITYGTARSGILSSIKTKMEKVAGWVTERIDPDKSDKPDKSYEPKVGVIRFCVEEDLGTKLIERAKMLRERKEILEEVEEWQAIWAILASIFVLFLVFLDYLDFLPIEFEFIEIELYILLSLAGSYFLLCTYNLNAIISRPRSDLKNNRFIFFFFVIPCAYCVGLLNRKKVKVPWIILIPIYFIIYFFFCKESQGSWIKKINLSTDEKIEIRSLLQGLDPVK